MVAFANHNRMKTFSTSFFKLRCATWTSGHVASSTFNPRRRVSFNARSDAPCAVTITVCVPTLAGLPFKPDSLGAQFRQHGFVVDQIAQNRERLAFGGFNRQRNGVP
jgi:hypothetical protein